jgi:cytochrome c peroxidase
VRRSRAAAALALGAALAAPVGAAADERAAFAAPEPGSYALPPLGAAADGAVRGDDGAPTTLHALFAGRLVLLAFVYSACADAEGCPLAHAVLHRLGRLLEDDPATRAQLRVLSLSFDPARDTPAAMARLAHAIDRGGLDWRFLTTDSAAELEPILAAYGQTRTPERDAQGRETGAIAHLLRVFLIDRAGRIRNVYGASFLDAELLRADLHSLLAEEAAGAAAAAPDAAATRAALPAGAGAPPLGLPPLPEAGAATPAQVALGRRLFFERRLSRNDTLACANCHVPEQGFTHHEQRTAVGIEGRSVRRNAPTLLNAAHARSLFHDGRADRLEEQVWDPLLAPNEMGNASAGRLLAKLAALPGYAALFAEAFPGRGITRESLGEALAAYERTLISGDSPFDRWRYAGDAAALDASAARGFALFTGRAGCVGCHRLGEREALFTDDAFHDTGVGAAAEARAAARALRVELAPGQVVELAGSLVAPLGEPPQPDLGRFEVTGDPADRHRYRTPSLRNVALTAPYMHDGSLATLEEVVAFYDRGGFASPGLDPRIRPLGLAPGEAADLVAFLRALSGRDVAALVADARAAPIGDVGSGAGGGS